MKNHTIALILAGCLALASGFAQATTISTSAGCSSPSSSGDSASCDPLVDDTYGYLFEIDDNGAPAGNTYSATLTNTSTVGTAPLIDLLAFNVNPDLVLGTDFNIVLDPITQNWTFTSSSGGIQFDYVGDANNPGDKLIAQQSLTFNFVFLNPTTPPGGFDWWTGSEGDAGSGIGGGGDSGQVAVSFQALDCKLFSGLPSTECSGPNSYPAWEGQGSDLLTSNWPGVPAPAALLLVGTGLFGMGVVRRFRLAA